MNRGIRSGDRAAEGSKGVLTRRRFLAEAARAAGAAGAAGVAGAVAAPCIIPASSLGLGARPAPSERITIGVIGTGGRGMDHTRAFAGSRDSQVLAVCDANKPKADAAKQHVDAAQANRGGAGGKACDAYADFREVLARSDIDAVAIASPENWHALQAAQAVRAGKDVYLEKALSLTVAEGRALCRAVRRYGRILQVGTQQRSDRNFRLACELARDGYLGDLKTVRVAVPGGRALPNAPPTPPPQGLDYDLWLGPAPYTPHNDIKCSYNWYFISDYCAGWIESWGVHHCDIALWGATALLESPLDVEGTAVFPKEGLADTSISWRVEYTARNGLRMIFTDEGQQPHGCRFEGDKGWVHVVRGGIQAEPAGLLRTAFGPGDERLYESNDHHGNFLGCIRTRREPVAPVEGGHAATTITLIGDIATRLGRKLRWDWHAEQFIDDDDANRMLARSMRDPWTL